MRGKTTRGLKIVWKTNGNPLIPERITFMMRNATFCTARGGVSACERAGFTRGLFQ